MHSGGRRRKQRSSGPKAAKRSKSHSKGRKRKSRSGGRKHH